MATLRINERITAELNSKLDASTSVHKLTFC